MDNKIVLVDGNSLLYRAFYALPLLQTRTGIYTNGVYGFFTMFDRVMAEEQPECVVVAFDKSRDTFRKEMYEDYKANRSAPPDELKGQFELLRKVLQARNISYLEMDGYEADDIIGTLSKRASVEGRECVIVTGDGDSLQLVSDRVNVLMTRKGITEIERYNPDKVLEKWQVPPEKMKDIKALMGDASDNIPGVPGVGSKTAIKLVKEFGNLENLYEKLDEVKGKKLVEKLSDNKEQAFLSRKLGTIITDMDINLTWEECKLQEPDRDSLLELYRELEFNSFIKALEAKIAQSERAGDESSRPIELIAIDSADKVDDLAKEASEQGMAIVIDGSSNHPMWSKLRGAYFAAGDRIYHVNFHEDKELFWLKDILESAEVKKYVHNAKYLRVLLKSRGIELDGIAGDTMLMAYVLDPAFDGEKLSATIMKYLNENIAENEFAQLVSRIPRLFNEMLERTDDDLKHLYYEVEVPLSRVLAAMEHTGVKVELMTLADISHDLAAGIACDQEKIYKLAGSEFNINSPKQLGKILFEDMGLRVIKKTKTGYSTGAEVLEELYEDHEIIPYISNYRQLTKLKSTYADALQGLIHPQTGRVHTIFKQAQTATGRLSSVEPNLQNIPIRMEEGRRIRKAFTAGDKNRVLLSADYSQIDLRSLAHISGDENLIETFKKGIDIHTRTASEIFHVELDAVDSELRRRAKAVNFGIVYGISDFGLARDTGVSRKEAKKYIENYLDSYPGVRRYMDDIVQYGIEYGYVETILKRRRYLPDLKARNKMIQAFARRMALNTPIQGTSADIIKLAMIDIHEQIVSRNFNCRLLLQVHDDLILEVPRKELEEVALMLKQCMENAYELKVPLKVSLQAGSNWYDMKEFKL